MEKEIEVFIMLVRNKIKSYTPPKRTILNKIPKRCKWMEKEFLGGYQIIFNVEVVKLNKSFFNWLILTLEGFNFNYNFHASDYYIDGSRVNSDPKCGDEEVTQHFTLYIGTVKNRTHSRYVTNWEEGFYSANNLKFFLNDGIEFKRKLHNSMVLSLMDEQKN